MRSLRLEMWVESVPMRLLKLGLGWILSEIGTEDGSNQHGTEGSDSSSLGEGVCVMRKHGKIGRVRTVLRWRV